MNILIADNQPLTVAGLLRFIQEKREIKVAGEVSSPEVLFGQVAEVKPDLLMVDYNLKDFISIHDLDKLIQQQPQLNVLVISSDNDKSSIRKVLQLGVKGYITKECDKDEVLQAIQTTARGEKFFCQKVLDILMEKHVAPSNALSENAKLTTRESEILQQIAEGKSSQQIADTLHLSPHTVQTHRKSIIRKLHIKSPTQFVIYAMDLGLLKSR